MWCMSAICETLYELYTQLGHIMFQSIICLVTNCLVTNCLVSNCLVSNCLVTNCLVSNLSVTNCLVNNCPSTEKNMDGIILTSYHLLLCISCLLTKNKFSWICPIRCLLCPFDLAVTYMFLNNKSTCTMSCS